MVITKRPGVYFTEATGSVISENDGGFIPLFVVQTGTAIATIDEQITFYESIDAFATVVEGKGLDKTVKYIREALNEASMGQFYVYSIKTDTAEGFTNAIKNCASRTEIRDVVYIEETKSTTATTCAAKVSAIKTALDDNFGKGTSRNALIVPYGTVDDAVKNAENTDARTTVITTLTSVFNGVSSGRITGLVPDDVFIGAGIGKFIGRAYNEEIGQFPITTSIDALTYNFDDAQLLQLVNIGCLVASSQRRGNDTQYKIEVGVTTAVKEDGADQLLISRSIADQMLRDVKAECDSFIKQKLTSNTVTFLQTEIDNIIENYVNNNDVEQEGTTLTVSRSTIPYTINIVGTIQVVGSLLVINVDTKLVI